MEINEKLIGRIFINISGNKVLIEAIRDGQIMFHNIDQKARSSFSISTLIRRFEDKDWKWYKTKNEKNI